MDRRNEVGIITYHSAYNYGSVLQAFATQEAVKELGYSVKIINYRMKEQQYYYSNIRTRYGIKVFLKDIAQLPVLKEKKSRQKRFEDFISNYMSLTNRFSDPLQMSDIAKGFPIIISGSDQIWNKHSCELENNEWEYMQPYLLSKQNCKKISYGSSIANMTDEELVYILPAISEFSHIAMREQCSADKLSMLLGKKVDFVLDPTFLLTREEWIRKLNLNIKEDDSTYILYYSLGRVKKQIERDKILKEISETLKCKIKVVTPFAYVPGTKNVIENHIEYGPIEFLNEIINAKYVITDSYHGTILSINLGKEVYSLCSMQGSEFRKTEILKRLGLENRIILEDEKLLEVDYEKKIDFEEIWKKLEIYRLKSKEYLCNSMKFVEDFQ